MSKKILTVSREFGSGGRSIGKAVAEKLGYAYYDKELITKVAEATGFDDKFIEEEGEYAPSKSFLAYAFAYAGPQRGIMDGLSTADYLWLAQRKVILELAEKEPCVIVGRCADFILRDNPDALHVFIHADTEYKAERVLRLYGETKMPVEERLKDKDDRRRVNYKHFTGREWGRSQNYDLTLNSAQIGEERCVSIIVDLMQNL
ncbi:MAG: AAA family ATPase [Oscillospiraceae bacterium]|jgi:cytidylate kinase